ncbi:MAG TPA: TnsD family Tn7-like transposition protein [Clostridium sp.]|uniref:TnsD family Tn7-like transposition protein n=1 Tax=Clostridium sp. TaxID=1506 RepID=UPI002F9533BA
MPTFFPTPYLGETLYGVISRFHVWGGNVNCKTTLRDLFNTTSVTAGRELPANINLLLSNLPEDCTLTVDEIITKHTLYKYYTAFLPNEKAKSVYDLMDKGEGSLIYTTLGMCNNTIKMDTNLKYCSTCVEEDRYTLGEAYFHLEHQIAGILMCHKHFTELRVCEKSMDYKNRQAYLNLEFSICGEDKIMVELNDNIRRHQTLFCNNVNKILNGDLKNREINFFREFYLSKLIEKNIAQSRSNINQEDLLEGFKYYYGEEYLSLIGCNFEITNKYNWVTAISRKHRTSFQPIQHLLIIDYLGIDIVNLFESNYVEVRKSKSYQVKTDEEKVEYRCKWLKFRKTYPDKSKSFIRDMDIATYTWLIRHDTKWLSDNSPCMKTYGFSKKIDWDKRDKDILKEIRVVVDDIYSSKGKPERVTVGLVGRKIDKLYLLQKYLDKMPKVKKYLENKIECVQEFQNRRMNWIILNFDDERIPREWEIKRLGGIR